MRKRLLPALAILGVLALVVAAPAGAHQRYANNDCYPGGTKAPCPTGKVNRDTDPYDECWKTTGGTADVPEYRQYLSGNRQMSTNLDPTKWGGVPGSWDRSAWFCIQDTHTDDANAPSTCADCVAGDGKTQPGEDTGFAWVYVQGTPGFWFRGESHCGAFGRSPTSIGAASLGTNNAYQGTQPRGVYVLQPDFCFTAATGDTRFKPLDSALNSTSATAWAALPVPACTSSTQATPCKDGPNEGIRVPVPLP